METLYRRVSGTFLIKILGLGMAFVFQIVIGRLLRPELYGQYTMLITYINVLSIIIVLGMDSNLIKEIAKVSENKSRSNSYLVLAFKISMFIFFFISILVITFHETLSLPYNMVHLFLFMLLLKVFMVVFDGFLQGVGLVVKVTLYNTLLNNFLKMILFFVFIYSRVDGLYAVLYSFIVSEVITVTLRSRSIKRVLGSSIGLKIGLSKDDKSQFIKYSITVALISGMGILMQNVDKIMIGNLLDFSDVGVYKVSQNYVSLISVFIVPFIAFWPMISKLYSENKMSEIEIHMKKIVKIVSHLVIPMFFVFLFLSERLLLMFGKDYVFDDAKNVLLILSLAFLIDAISGPIGSILTMTNYARYILINNIISLILNVVLNFILIKTYGIIGVAIGTGVSVIVNNLISILEVKILLGIFSYDFTNFIQIVILSIGNFLLGKWLNSIINISNTYVYIIIFGLIVYLINFVAIAIVYRKFIIKTIKKG